jgi:hypothetical protein
MYKPAPPAACQDGFARRKLVLAANPNIPVSRKIRKAQGGAVPTAEDQLARERAGYGRP